VGVVVRKVQRLWIEEAARSMPHDAAAAARDPKLQMEHVLERRDAISAMNVNLWSHLYGFCIVFDTN
jgi:hypothetical protein